MGVTESDVRAVLNDDAYFWHIGDEVLYDMCRKYPAHDREDVIAAKAWLIGRAYAAAIERGAARDPGEARDTTAFIASAWRGR